MKKWAVFLFVCIFIPLFGILSGFVQSRFKTIQYSLMIMLIIVCLVRMSRFPWIDSLRRITSFIFLGIFLVGIAGIHIFDESYTLTDFFSICSGIILSLLIILYFSTFSDRNKIELFNYLSFLVAVAFVLQFLFSIYESRSGEVIGTVYQGLNEELGHGYATGSAMQQRLVFRLLGVDFAQLFSLQLPFTGLLGQHNYWGTQLPFYNLIFWIQFLHNGNRRYIPLLVLTFLAAILNTSRFGILSITVTGMIFLTRYTVMKRHAPLLWSFLGLGIVYTVYSDIFLASIADYFTETDTIYGRMVNYGIFLDYIPNMDIYHLVFGNGTAGISKILMEAIGEDASFESQIFSTFFMSGVLGLSVIVGFLVETIRKSKQLDKTRILLASLLVFNFIGVSIISNLVFYYAIIAIVSIIYVYIFTPFLEVEPGDGFREVVL